MNNNIWAQTIDELSQLTARPIYALELPGYGDQKNIGDEHDLASLSEWLNEQVDTPSMILGWSLGGLVATRFALDFPAKVTKLGLIASSPKFIAEDSWPGIQPEVLTNFAAELGSDHESVVARFMAIQAMGSKTAKQDIKHIKSAVLAKPTPTPEVLAQGLKILQQADLRSVLTKLSVPTALILGRLDALVPRKLADQLPEFSEDIKITMIEKASHAPFISHPEAFQRWFSEQLDD